ncbi:uncharacterized protein KNAG_0E03090 [Huiozyma naganishii CBS 8797]|uniref:Major facilitator superfamily (MFS) profile domain-containing protein n=1 Tax=Huiozyma naganishii (strain ATCC MYA-139 / BCRC 22969 / CBS 8797 / KCTC 17520 / NBRC 10181 / NCYC 3082 / Yp74L-3) TaxID=1071383 RepID=J7RM01_HUIN7|nr:hypothetical protein KNAG_0E03090 [Kazachstania naganishii CBS 8797]CCK70568.1 hypothetical protein KNAG_0E03090 [Kazachstania naganishii CBS 8797]
MFFPKKLLGLKHETPTYSLKKIGLIIVLAGFLVGLEMTSLTVLISDVEIMKYLGDPSPIIQGTLVAANIVGGLFGCVLYTLLLNRYGRVELFQLGCIIWFSGCFISSAVIDVWVLILSRFMRGLTVGMYSVLLSSYTIELFPQSKRNVVLALTQLANSCGMLVMYYASMASLLVPPGSSFRIVFAIECVPGVVLYIISIWLPESPSWLVKQSQFGRGQFIQNEIAVRYNEKRDLQNRLPILHKVELCEMYCEESDQGSFRSIFRRPQLPFTLFGVLLQLVIQCSGINFLLYYVNFFMEMIGLDGSTKFLSGAIPFWIMFLLSSVPVCFINKVNKRFVIVCGVVVLGSIMVTVSVLMRVYGHEASLPGMFWVVENFKIGAVILGLCFLFIGTFALSLSSMVWIYTNEVLPPRGKSKNLAFCMCSGWCCNFVITLLAPTLIEQLKWAVFLLFGCTSFVLALVIAFGAPRHDHIRQEEEKKEESKDTSPTESNTEPIQMTEWV